MPKYIWVGRFFTRTGEEDLTHPMIGSQETAFRVKRVFPVYTGIVGSTPVTNADADEIARQKAQEWMKEFSIAFGTVRGICLLRRVVFWIFRWRLL